MYTSNNLSLLFLDYAIRFIRRTGWGIDFAHEKDPARLVVRTANTFKNLLYSSITYEC